jgi:hypothetical protein
MMTTDVDIISDPLPGLLMILVTESRITKRPGNAKSVGLVSTGRVKQLKGAFLTTKRTLMLILSWELMAS